MIEKVIGWVVPFVLGGIVSAVMMWFLFFRAFRDGLQCLLRAEIIRQNEKWTEKRYCPIYAKQALSRAYKAYHALKGNDVATALYEEVMELPERKEV
jgi:hypothetical protein